jgi:hypothetical protein
MTAGAKRRSTGVKRIFESLPEVSEEGPRAHE